MAIIIGSDEAGKRLKEVIKRLGHKSLKKQQ
ncbi:Uncharacterised protein [Staphylococcus aureus]|nr:Uncharacterised protein [Staphylococcus aureus]